MSAPVFSVPVELAPGAWGAACVHTENKLHQLSPYIGKLKSSIAGDLVERFSNPCDLVVDPFCGSGTVPLEAALRGRRTLSFDASEYAVLLTRAKLGAPESLVTARKRLDELVASIPARRKEVDLRRVPAWVRRFFHNDTLRDAIAFADACRSSGDHFFLACLLGILHHQRPGFLSFPSSHLVPYLRERLFPRATYPEMYRYREVGPRMVKKVERALTSGAQHVYSHVGRVPVEELRLDTQVDSIITSPPYMNALDYRRDNRLRLWLLDRETRDYSREPTDEKGSFRQLVAAFARNVLPRLKADGYCVMVVGETVTRNRSSGHPASVVVETLQEQQMVLERVIADTIPDVRRARRTHSATKRELVLVFRKPRCD